MDKQDRQDQSQPRGLERREFLKRAAALGMSVPAAGAILAPAAAAKPTIQVRERARPFEGVTLQLAKAPFGNDEKQVVAKLLAPFLKKTGMTVQHTVIPWNTEGAAYATNYAGPNPYDVSYQTNTDLTSLGTKGVLEVLNTKHWFDSPAYLAQRKHYIPSVVDASTYQGKLYGVPFIIGTIVMYYNKDLLQKAGITKVPATMTELTAAARKVTSSPQTWGFQVPMTAADFNWYFNLQNVHDFGGDIFSKDAKRATINSPAVVKATQWSTDLILKYKVQPPVGQYDREGGVSLFKAGRIAFLVDEPLRLPVFKSEKLPFKWDFAMPVGAPGGKRTVFSTTGHWVMAAKSKNQKAAWALIEYLSSPAFSRPFNEHYGFIPTRNDVDISHGDPMVKRNFSYALCCWQGMRAQPKTAQLLDAYGQALEASATGSQTVKAALAKGQATAAQILKS